MKDAQCRVAQNHQRLSRLFARCTCRGRAGTWRVLLDLRNMQRGELRLVDRRDGILNGGVVASPRPWCQTVLADEPRGALDALIQSGNSLRAGEIEIAEVDTSVRLRGQRHPCKCNADDQRGGGSFVSSIHHVRCPWSAV